MSNVAKTQKRIAEIYEKDGEFTMAMKSYKEAADNYSLEQNQTSNYNSCMLKVVDIGVMVAVPDFGELIKILESVADKYMQNKLTAPSAKEQYFKAVLLFLANDDVVGADQALKRYLNNDPTFFNTRQQKFAQALITSVKEQNIGLFSNECIKFNEIIPFDKWKTVVLTKIKGLIPEEGTAPSGNKAT